VSRGVRDPRRRLRKVARIARWEVSHTLGTMDRRTVALVGIAVVLGLGVAGGSAVAGNVALDNDLYRVSVAEESPYHEPVEAAPSLTPVGPESDDWDVAVLDRNRSDRNAVFQARDTPKGRAALDTLRGAVEAYNDQRMAREDNQSAAFPVEVTLQYATRETGDGGTGGGGTDGGGTETAGGAGGGDDATATDTETERDESGGGIGLPNVGDALFAGGQSGSPADVQPPFPFASLVLAFAFLVPLNFIAQAYGGTVLDERIDRRGELLLVAPVEPGDVVAGKTLPYVLSALILTSIVAVVVGGGPVSVLAVLPLALLYLAGTFVGGMFARSFKELTFVTVALSVFLTAYAFVPAIFTNVTPVALISPLTLVVRDLQGTGITLGQYVFSTGPAYVAGGVLFLLGLGVYREEDMFTQRSVPLKLLDAIDARIAGRRSATTLSALFIPFVFVAELLAVAVLFALPIDVSIPVLLVAIAGVEEVAKSVHLYAGFEKERFDRTLGTALLVGALSGLGFFVGEKVTVVVQLVGLPEVTLGRLAFATGGAGVGQVGPVAALGLLFAPLALHAVTAAISAVGASRGRNPYLVAMTLAVLVHAAYNLTVVGRLA
jgi:ABC-type Na+ efflux pump permease subunit